MGGPIERVFDDRDVFADFFTRYYTDYEPQSALVIEDRDAQRVVGYLLGCFRYRSYPWRMQWLLWTRIVPKVVWRFLTGRYDRKSRRFLYWTIFRSIRETPPAPKHAGHFHFNVLPEYRVGVATRRLTQQFFRMAQASGVPRIYGQIQMRDDRRTAFYKRYGFSEFSRRRITKFAHLEAAPIYVTTLVREFARNG